MRGRLFTIIILSCWMLHCEAQHMKVEQFTRLRRPLWNRSKVTVDKGQALVDLETAEKGFAFSTTDNQPAEAEEGDGFITVKLPHKTQYVIIKHPDYGQLSWRVPVKHLKRKKHYKATLWTSNPVKEYKLQRQWVVFNVSPKNAIIQIDSTVTLTREQTTTFYLPPGNHTYKVSSPFYEEVNDTFLLTDTAKLVLDINLQPIYSYLTVRTPWERGEIHVDGQTVGMKEGTSKRLASGTHRVSVFVGNICCYDAFCTVGEAEKKVITLTEKDYRVQPLTKKSLLAVTPPHDVVVPDTGTMVINRKKSASVVYVPTTLKAPDDDTEILVDREKVGEGIWSGQLSQGYHIVGTRKDGVESPPSELWITSEAPQEINLAVPQTSCGMLNISCNVVGAKVFIDNISSGETPIITPCLPAHRSYVISVQKEGYHTVEKTVQPKGNDLVDIYIKLKKR